MGDALSWAGVILAAASSAGAVIAWGLRRRAQRRLSLQAQLQPELRETGRGSERLFLVNHGMGEARNIRVKLDGVPLAKHCAAVRGDSMPSLVGPGGEISCLLGTDLQCAPPFEIEVCWEDDFGKDRTYRTTLTY
jgi:hypothetical protein